MQENELGRPSDVHLKEEKCVKISVVKVKERGYLGNVGGDRSLVLRKGLKGIYETVG